MSHIRESTCYRVVKAIIVVFLFLCAIVCILPFVHILAVSFSDAASTSANSVGLWPVGFHVNAYIKVFKDVTIYRAFSVTIVRMILGTLYSMVLTVLAAYPLSFDKETLPGRSFYVGFFFFSMLFSGGIVPYYMLIKELHLIDSLWALILGTLPVGNTIILMNFFRSLPRGLYEAARIDGASHFKVLTRIYVPLSLPSLATLSMLCMIGHWNDWFTGVIFMKSPEKYPLQTFLYHALQNVSEHSIPGSDASLLAPRQAVIAAQIVVSILPVLAVYPVLYRYIRVGLVLGSVKE